MSHEETRETPFRAPRSPPPRPAGGKYVATRLGGDGRGSRVGHSHRRPRHRRHDHIVARRWRLSTEGLGTILRVETSRARAASSGQEVVKAAAPDNALRGNIGSSRRLLALSHMPTGPSWRGARVVQAPNVSGPSSVPSQDGPSSRLPGPRARSPTPPPAPASRRTCRPPGFCSSPAPRPSTSLIAAPRPRCRT